MSSTRIGRGLALLAIVGVTLIAMAIPPAGAQTPTEPTFIVEVQADGSAVVSVQHTFDLTTDSEQVAFRTLMNDTEAQQEATDRFLNRMQTVASDAENATGREMAVTDATSDLDRTADNETGIVTLSVYWEGLAAERGEKLLVTEPFASGFETDRRVVLRVPSGYTVTSASPTPDSSSEGQVAWNAGRDLSGFAVAIDPAEEASSGTRQGTTRTGGQPGFGFVLALLAVLVTGSIALSRRKRPDT